MKTKEPKYEYDKEYKITWHASKILKGYEIEEFLKKFEGKTVPHWVEILRKGIKWKKKLVSLVNFGTTDNQN